MQLSADEYVQLLDGLMEVYYKNEEEDHGREVCGCYREKAGEFIMKFFGISSEDAVEAFNKVRPRLKSVTIDMECDNCGYVNVVQFDLETHTKLGDKCAYCSEPLRVDWMEG